MYFEGKLKLQTPLTRKTQTLIELQQGYIQSDVKQCFTENKLTNTTSKYNTITTTEKRKQAANTKKETGNLQDDCNINT